MSKCLDCGCGLEAGICSNCHEELFITTFQSDDFIEPPSKKFTDKAMEQKEQIENRNRIIREDPEVFRDLKDTDIYYK